MLSSEPVSVWASTITTGGHMKGLFPQYNDVSTVDYDDVWKNALFVFDTNVLLNLYRYQTNTREELITVLGELSDRIWIPHHVALEFQRNRLHVVADQSRRFFEIQDVIEKAKSSLSNDIDKLQLHKRHALINPDSLISGFKELADKFLKELKTLQESQQQLTATDPLKQQIEDLFDGKVGPSFPTQKDIDDLFKIADIRYKCKIPPGYEDSKKDKHSIDEFAHRGIIYKRKYGDYLVWRQILNHIKNAKIEKIIFVTDDGKEDWWRKIDLQGSKTIGPRPELTEEASEAGAETFLMYKPEGFLKFSQTFLKAKISEQTLNEVRDISSANKNKFSTLNPAHPYSALYTAIANWILNIYPILEESSEGYIDFIAQNGNEHHAYDVRHIDTLDADVISRVIRQGIRISHISKFTTITIFLVLSNNIDTVEAIKSLQNIEISKAPENVHVAIAHFDESGFPKLKVSHISQLKELCNFYFVE